jgi:D-sedoheptulose 7-phosphate isomerase
MATDDIGEPLQAMFADHVDTVYRSLDTIYPLLHRAVELLCETMLEEHKILVCGAGTGAALSQVFCAELLNRVHIDRPALPVVAIGADAATQGAIAQSYGSTEVYARQILALGQHGDALLLVMTLPRNSNLAQAMAAAHSRGMRIIALTAGETADEFHLPGADDIELRVPSDNPARAAECHMLLLNSLAALIESQLFGAN